jgi:hypothetical protein
MQQTRLDRWLKEKFVLETHVLTLSAPPHVPAGVKLREMESGIGNRFKYSMVIRDRRALEAALQALVDANQTFTTQVQSRKTVLRRVFDDPLGGSFTWRVIGFALGLSLAILGFLYLPWDQAYRILEAFEFLRQYT